MAACNSVGKLERFGDRDIAFICDYCDGYIVWEDLSAMPSTRLKRSPRELANEQRRSRERESLVSMARTARGHRELVLPRYQAEQQLVDMDAASRSSVAASSEAGTRCSIATDSPVASTASTLLGTTKPSGPAEYDWMATGISFTSVEDHDDGDDDNGEGAPPEKTVVFAPVAIANHVPPAEGEWQARLLCPYCDDWVVYSQGDDEMEAVRYAQDENGFESLEKLREHLAWYHAPGYLESVASPVKKAATDSGCVVM